MKFDEGKWRSEEKVGQIEIYELIFVNLCPFHVGVENPL